MNGLDRLHKTVSAIYKANDEGGAATLGLGRETLPDNWETFFKRSREELRKQEQPKPEPKPESEEKDILAEILTGIIQRIEAIESRLAIVEGIDELQEEIVKEPVRKGLDPETFLLKMQLEGAHGELRTRRGQKWQKN